MTCRPAPLTALTLRVALLVLAAVLAAGPARAQYFGFGKNRVQYEGQAWEVLQSEHFDVFYYEPAGRAPSGYVVASFAAEAAEEAYGEVAALFAADLERRVPLLVYPTHVAFAVTNAADLPVGAEAIGGVTERFKNRVVVPFTGDWRDFRRVVHHELVHAVVNDVYDGGPFLSLSRGGAGVQIPAWFNEGLAEYSAQTWDTESDMYVREAVLNDGLADIPDLRGYFAYRGGQGVWDFVAEEYGRETVTQILDGLRLGRSVGGAFEQATGLGLGELSERWKRALRDVYFPEAVAREEAAAVARPVATSDPGGAGYHASPALSPQGDRVAYVASHDGLFDVFVAPAVGGGEPTKLLDGQDNTSFERLRILSPGLSWSPDGRRLAVAVTSGADETIALVDVESGDIERLRPDRVDAVVSVAWSPDGGRVAFEGVSGAQSDLYVLDLETGALANLTRDLYADHAPAWAPDGRSLVFHSDRGAAVELGRATAAAARSGAFDAHALGRGGYDLYRVAVDGPARAERLTDDPVWDETRPALAPGPGGGVRLLFVSDRNGIPNLYALDLPAPPSDATPPAPPDGAGAGGAALDSAATGAAATDAAATGGAGLGGAARPLTDLEAGVLDVSLAADGGRAALLALSGGAPSVFVLRDPFGRGDLPAVLAPTVWAQRRAGAAGEAPSLRLASAATQQRNPFLRDAADGAPPDAPGRREPPSAEDVAFADSVLALFGPPADFLASADPAALDPADPARGPRVAYQDYAFSDAFEGGAAHRPLLTEAARDTAGVLVARPYRLRFSHDYAVVAGSYETVYGIQTATQVRFSDVLGNHEVSLTTNLVFDLRNINYVLGYAYRAGRTDYAVESFQVVREFSDFANATVVRYRNYGLVGRATYPLDTFRRLDAEVGLVGVSLADLSDLGRRPRSRLFAVPRLTYTRDVTVPGVLGPRSGSRWAASVSGSPGPNAFFASALVDARRYWTLGPGYTLALRGSAGISVGPDPQRFYAAGVQNWVNADVETVPVRNASDFVFATPVLPLRGSGFNETAGDRFALVNAELRLPLVAALLPGPLPVLPLYDVQAVGFVDAGFISEGGVELFRDAEVTGDDGETTTRRAFDDALLGVGAGLRTVVLGFPVRLDWAWPFDGTGFGDGRLYLSAGLDF
ncbi:peptidase MA family metallohydrolase [Rubrivirga litoralis]|uniref:Peptidase S9 n=1 Tax=Rubrivirga litoralis TaxID=3075598 RepID=A0ABU3BUR9_9BACT|nr:peptidase S9 [Rubrivirga sp. F394]MDT0633041.1 peptidase S9 [Rubrivirga sp. F394]